MLVAVAVSTSCGPTLQTTYKDFYQSRKYQGVSVSSDASLMQDKIGKKPDAFVVDESSSLVAKIQSNAIAALRAKGYDPVTADYQSTGGTRLARIPVFVAESRDSDGGASLDGAYSVTLSGKTVSSSRKNALDRVISKALAAPTLGAAASNHYIPEVKELGLGGGRYVCVIVGAGRNVSFGKQMGQSIATGVVSTLLTGGLITYTAHEVDITVLRAVIVDPESGKMVWANRVQASPDVESIAGKVQTLFDAMPPAR